MGRKVIKKCQSSRLSYHLLKFQCFVSAKIQRKRKNKVLYKIFPGHSTKCCFPTPKKYELVLQIAQMTSNGDLREICAKGAHLCSYILHIAVKGSRNSFYQQSIPFFLQPSSQSISSSSSPEASASTFKSLTLYSFVLPVVKQSNIIHE